jgi:hypothetical protein
MSEEKKDEAKFTWKNPDPTTFKYEFAYLIDSETDEVIALLEPVKPVKERNEVK